MTERQAGVEEVPPGYKRTEVGVIPEDWEAIPLRDDISLLSGHHVLARHCNIHGDGVPYLTGPADFPDGHIQQTKFTTHPTTLCREGDILVTVKGSGSGSLIEADASYCISRQLMAIRVKQWNSKFLYYSLLQNANQIKAASTGLIPGLSRSDILDQRIPLPPTVTEQHAIAAALSDVDRLIGALDALIEKKRAIKQAAMQQLLTGKTRLPGFTGKWQMIRAGEIGRFRGGSGFPTKFQGATSGDYPFFKVSDMNNEGNEIFMETANNYISEEVRKQLGATVFLDKSIIFAKVGAAVFLERKKILTKASCLDNNMAAFVIDDSLADCRFLHYALLNIKLGDLVSTTALPSISGSALSAIELQIPPPIEQTAIATVLSDMDAEIAALERRRAKAEQIKQGMMQQLLTGRVRLPMAVEETAS